MKRASLLVLAFIAFAFTGTAQVKYGAKAGINLANLKGKSEGESQSLDSKVGLHIGALVEIPVSENFSVMPELNFDQWGAQEEESGITGKFNVNYLNIPVLAKYNVGGLGIYAGPQIGFLMSANIKVEDEDDIDLKDQFKGTDISAVFGAEYNLPYGIFVTARYNLGLTRINDESSDDDYAKNSAITFGVGIKFGGASGAAKK